MRLQVGKFYITRDNITVGPMKAEGYYFMAIVNGVERLWNIQGYRAFEGAVGDIVQEVEQPKVNFTDWVIVVKGAPVPATAQRVALPDGSTAFRMPVEPVKFSLYGHSMDGVFDKFCSPTDNWVIEFDTINDEPVEGAATIKRIVK